MIGTLGGAIIGAGITWLIERDRRRHERQGRWLAERRTLYAAVLRTADAYTAQSLERARQLSLRFEGKWRGPVTPVADDLAFKQSVAEAELLVRPATEAALLFLKTSLYYVDDIRYPDEDDSMDEPAIKKARDVYADARRTFVDAVRRDLDVRQTARPSVWRRLWSRLR